MIIENNLILILNLNIFDDHGEQFFLLFKKKKIFWFDNNFAFSSRVFLIGTEKFYVFPTNKQNSTLAYTHPLHFFT